MVVARVDLPCRPPSEGSAGVTVEVPSHLPGLSGRVRLSVADAPARLSDMVPLARWLSDRLTRYVVRSARKAGLGVPCRQGCTACCRYLVPLSVPEALRIRVELARLPEGARLKAERAFLQAAGRIVGACNSGQSPLAAAGPAGLAADGPDAPGRWYAQLGLSCPLLAGDRCRLYSCRPIACREHLVTSGPEGCAGLAPAIASRLQGPASAATALTLLTAELEQREPEAVMLPLLTAWCDDNGCRDQRTWPAPLMVGRLLEILARLADDGRGLPSAWTAVA